MASLHDEPRLTLDPKALPPLSLPQDVTSRFIDCSPSSLIFHILESGFEPARPNAKPLILLVHGFPELAYSWRFILPQLAAQTPGYHVVALDQRGYGRTHSPDHPHSIPANTFRPTSLIRDILNLTSALGYTSVSCIAGHDFGAVTATLCALSRPDIFKSVVLLSHPFKGTPMLPLNIANDLSARPAPKTDMEALLRQLDPPRKHYKWYYCTSPANDNMTNPPGKPLHTFLRGYFHLKSADWAGNSPRALSAWTADQLAQMPRYYIMDADAGMRENVARDMASELAEGELVTQKSDRWLPDADLAVYVSEYARTSFQGGLNWYRIQTQPDFLAEYEIWTGRKIEVPTVFVAGEKDWGTYQEPGAVEAMETGGSVEAGYYRGTRIVKGAGHWVTQEQAEVCARIIGEMAREGLSGKMSG